MDHTKVVGKQSIKTIPKKPQTLDLLNKYFKSIIVNMFKELNKTMFKELKDGMIMISYS